MFSPEFEIDLEKFDSCFWDEQLFSMSYDIYSLEYMAKIKTLNTSYYKSERG
jgi:hypothetical protein